MKAKPDAEALRSVGVYSQARVRMPLSPDEFSRLTEALIHRGWRWSNDELRGPNDKWFAEKRHESLAAYRDWAVSKKCELVEFRAEPEFIGDLRSLAEVLEELCDDGGLEAFFAAIEPTLVEFARLRNLRIDKYAVREPRWSFDFLHPTGFHGSRCAHGSLDVYRHSRDHVWFHLCLMEDDARTRTRRIRREETPVQKLAQINLTDELDKHLRRIVGWELNSWTSTSAPDPQWNPPRSDDEVREIEDHLKAYLPIPRL